MPLVIGFLDWERHVFGGGAGGTEKAAEEWDDRHRPQYGDSSEWLESSVVGVCASCEVAECVESADDAGPSRDTHGVFICYGRDLIHC